MFTVDSPYAGGAERYIALIAASLDRRRFTPTVLASAAPALDTWCRDVGSLHVPVLRAPMGLPFKPADAVPIFRAMHRTAPDLVHVNMPGPYDGQMALLAPIARLAGADAVVVTEHLPMVERLWKRASVKGMAYHFVDRVLTVSKANVPYLVRRQHVAAERIEIVYNGIPAEFGRSRALVRTAARRAFAVPDDVVAVVMVGSMIERKGVGVLVDAASLMTDRPWMLLLAGSGEQQTEFEQAAEVRGIANRTQFLGQLSSADVERLLAAADVLVLPSLMEGMP
jgi:glycosyltransferase involved in cell wall biosynthesis